MYKQSSLYNKPEPQLNFFMYKQSSDMENRFVILIFTKMLVELYSIFDKQMA